jgi:hypothetical protein
LLKTAETRRHPANKKAGKTCVSDFRALVGQQLNRFVDVS